MTATTEKRNKQIIKYNIIGIVMNAVLAVVKIIIGIAAGAHAIVLDGVNGLSDMTSSVLTIISALLSNRRGSRKVPMGYGRLEYLFSIIITCIIIYIGIRSVIDSITSLLNPHDPPAYDLILVIIMCISLIAKTGYGLMMRKKGRELSSIAMVMAGTDSFGDAMIAVAILIAMFVYNTTKVDIEHCLCIAISLLIIYTGVRMIIESMIKILGERVDPEYKRKVLNLFLSEKGVLNAFNLILHNYGEGVYVGSVDIEVDEKMTALEISLLSRKLIRRAREVELTLTSVGISAANISDPRAFDLWDIIIQATRKYKAIIGVTSLVVDFEEKVISFYVIPDRRSKNADKEMDALLKDLQGLFPDMFIEMTEVPDM